MEIIQKGNKELREKVHKYSTCKTIFKYDPYADYKIEYDEDHDKIKVFRCPICNKKFYLDLKTVMKIISGVIISVILLILICNW